MTLFVSLAVALFSQSAPIEEGVTILLNPPLDRLTQEAGVFMEKRLEQQGYTRRAPAALKSEALMAKFADEFGTNLIVFFDAHAGFVAAYRKRDSVFVTRKLPERRAQESAYAMAIAAAELVEILDERKETFQPTLQTLLDATSEPKTTSPSWTRKLRLGLGPAVGMGGGLDGAWVQPTFQTAVQIDAPDASLYGRLGLRAVGLGSETKGTGASLPASLRVRRDELYLEMGAGWASSWLTTGLTVAFGASHIEGTAVSKESGVDLSSESRFSPSLAVGIDLEVPLFDSFSLGAESSLIVPLKPTRFLIQGEEALLEEARIRAGIALIWLIEL